MGKYDDYDYVSFSATVKQAISDGLDYVAFGYHMGVAGSTVCRWASQTARPHPLIADKVLRELPSFLHECHHKINQ